MIEWLAVILANIAILVGTILLLIKQAKTKKWSWFIPTAIFLLFIVVAWILLRIMLTIKIAVLILVIKTLVVQAKSKEWSWFVLTLLFFPLFIIYWIVKRVKKKNTRLILIVFVSLIILYIVLKTAVGIFSLGNDCGSIGLIQKPCKCIGIKASNICSVGLGGHCDVIGLRCLGINKGCYQYNYTIGSQVNVPC